RGCCPRPAHRATTSGAGTPCRAACRGARSAARARRTTGGRGERPRRRGSAGGGPRPFGAGRTRTSGRTARAPGRSRLSSKPARLSGPAAPFCIAMQVAETVADSFPTRARWPALICIVAGLGFVFDVYEIVVQPILLRPVLLDLGGLDPGTPAFNRWAGWLLFFPPATGGLFGLLGGYLTRSEERRVGKEGRARGSPWRERNTIMARGNAH